MVVAVTGASGFVGKALMRRLGEGAQALSLRSAVPDISGTSDISDGSAWTSQLKHVDCVVHLAARVHVMHDTAADPLADFRAVNVALSLQLAQAAVAAGVRRLIYLSSVKVNGDNTLAGKPFRESDLAQPPDPYGVSKWEAENALLAFARNNPLEVVIIRPPLVYGPGVKANFARLINLVGKGIPLPFAALDNRRSLVSIDNLVDFIICAMQHKSAAGEVFMVSDGDDISTPELIRRIAHAQGRSARLLAVPPSALQWIGKISGKSDVVERLCGNLQVDIEKARVILGWQPRYSMQECLKRTVHTLAP